MKNFINLIAWIISVFTMESHRKQRETVGHVFGAIAALGLLYGLGFLLVDEQERNIKTRAERLQCKTACYEQSWPEYEILDKKCFCKNKDKVKRAY